MSDAPERISLELRQGMADDFWSECRDPRYAKSEPVAYVRADLVAAQEALLKEAMEALDERDGGTHDGGCWVYLSFRKRCNCGHERAEAHDGEAPMTIDHDAIAARVRQDVKRGPVGPFIAQGADAHRIDGLPDLEAAYLDLYDDRARIAAEWAKVSQRNYQRAKSAEAERDALRALDVEKQAERDFALKDFGQKPAPVVVRVKPLVAGRHPRGFIATDHGGGGAYIFALNGGRYECIKGLAHSPRFDTSKEALAAAQADHNARVLSQIDAVPAAQARAEALEEAAALPPYDSDGDPAGSFDHHVFVKRDAIRALIEKEQT